MIALLVLAFACTKDEIDIDSLLDFPPGIVSITPVDNGKVVAGNFDVMVQLADGESSPLASATLVLSDEFGNELASKTSELSGTRDSIVLLGTDFSADLLGAGSYTINVSATDTKGQTTDRTTTFEISLLAFAANHNEMWIAGAFNGWGADAMELVADFTWEIRDVDLNGEGWKFKNCFDWCDEDWGDDDCNGIMTSNMSDTGNGNTECGFSGAVIVTFNDQTLEYSVRPAVEFATNLSGLYLLGDFNDFEGGEAAFSLVADNTWELTEVLIAPGDKFRFAEMPNFMGKNFGDADNDGVAEEFGDVNAVFPEGLEEGFYSFTFNDATLAYSYEFVRPPFTLQTIGVIGSATKGGWDNDTDLSDEDGDMIYTAVVGLIEGEAKFRANDDWATNWGSPDFPAGTGTQDGDNIIVPEGGIYQVSLNALTGEYSFTQLSIGIIGSATPGEWAEDTDMTQDMDDIHLVTINIELIDGEAKFRANDDWAINWGADTFPTGTGTQDGPNIPITAGNYTVLFDVYTGEYSFE